MEADKIAESLHSLERRVVMLLSESCELEDLVRKSGLKEVEVMRALQWLQNKDIVKISYEVKEFVSLDKNGERYLKVGLPERRFLNAALMEKKIGLKEIKKKASLDDEEFGASLGILRQRGFIEIKDNEVMVTERGSSYLKKEFLEELFLKKISKPLLISELSPEERFALDSLKKRKGLVRISLKKNVLAELTALGKAVVKSKRLNLDVVDRLTSAMLLTKEWKKKNFRSYDVRINVPKVFAAKKQHYRAFLDYARKKFLSLGFTEMSGPIVETEFWNMDALFMPQFHSARDIHDVYYLKEPRHLAVDKKILIRVKAAHENGGKTGSKGWRYSFDSKKTTRAILRSQGTACSARMLASKELSIPGKYFGIARCFRHDVIDATHNVDFYQTEGIVVEKGLNLRHLFGLLKMFAEEFADAKEIKIVPGYFPFTEPSCELFAKHPELGWIELGGAGIFRPEVVKPLIGKDISVLAWGLGIDRIALFRLGMKDIRMLFSHDIEFLRSAKVF